MTNVAITSNIKIESYDSNSSSALRCNQELRSQMSNKFVDRSKWLQSALLVSLLDYAAHKNTIVKYQKVDL